MNLPRTSGVQLHPTSLPSGRLGPEAYAWVDWLAAAGPDVVADAAARAARQARLAVQVGVGVRGLAGAAGRAGRAGHRAPSALRFRERAADWIEDWIAFAGADALDDQVRFDREWAALRALRRRARREADRRRPDLRRRRLRRRSARTRRSSSAGAVAGVPPDAFTDDGQLWGNPLYDWPALRRQRLRVVDRALPAHLRALRPRADRPLPRASSAYWAVPADAEYALEGAWKRGPGRAPFDAAREALGELPLIAEDLGVITPPVTRLRESLGLAGHGGAAVRLHARPSATPQHVPENHAENQVVYTGTHDNDTIRGWYDVARRRSSARCVDAALARARHRRPRAALGADPARVRLARR